MSGLFEVRVFNKDGVLKNTICRETLLAKIWKDEGIDQTGKPRIIKIVGTGKCLECGKDFPKTRDSQIFCKGEDGKKDRNICHENWVKRKAKAPEVEHLCKGKCGKTFMGTESRKFCNNPCRSKGADAPSKNRKKSDDS